MEHLFQIRTIKCKLQLIYLMIYMMHGMELTKKVKINLWHWTKLLNIENGDMSKKVLNLFKKYNLKKFLLNLRKIYNELINYNLS